MRLLLVIAIVTFSVEINSHVVPAQAKNTIPPLSEDEKIRSQQFVVDLARNFSSFYFQKMSSVVTSDRIVSPLSVFIPMSMLSYGARGKTRKMFLDAIGLPEYNTRMAKVGYETLLDHLAKYNVRIRTKMFVPSGVRLKSHFMNLITKVFNSDVEALDRIDGIMDSSKIDEWIAAQTNDNVTELFEPQPMGRDPNIVFVNTVYFKGIWKTAFIKSRTIPRPFHPVNGRPLDVPTMYTIGRFQHGRLDEFNAFFIELPYKSNSKDDAMSMFVVLPDKETYQEWHFLVFKLRNMNLIRLLNSTEKEVEVYLPKFKIQTELSLNKVLKEIWSPNLALVENHINSPPLVTELRNRVVLNTSYTINENTARANFSGIFESSTQSNLNETAMKIVIEVDEKGQQTAESSRISYNLPEPVSSDRKIRSIAASAVQFIVDRPFIAIIATKGKVLTDIFSINFRGIQFIPKDLGLWW